MLITVREQDTSGENAKPQSARRILQFGQFGFPQDDPCAIGIRNFFGLLVIYQQQQEKPHGNVPGLRFSIFRHFSIV